MPPHRNDPPFRKPQFDVERRGNGQRVPFKKPKAWNHQDELRAARGRNIRLVFADDDKVDGVLIEADQFTIKMQPTDPRTREGVPAVYFKSNLSGFYILPVVDKP